jgi:hypothetical protein
LIVDPNSPLRSGLGQSKTELWYVWAEVALDHAATARVARNDATQAIARADRPFGPLEREMKASMVAIASSAHAIDAFATAAREAGQVSHELLVQWRAERTNRVGQIHQTLLRTFDVGNRAKVWYGDLARLFRLRDETVHHEARWADLERHPLGFDTSRTAATYTLEAAVQATDLLVEVIIGCLSNPKTNPDVKRWASLWIDLGRELKELQDLNAH